MSFSYLQKAGTTFGYTQSGIFGALAKEAAIV